jgi:hypothetical protein
LRYIRTPRRAALCGCGSFEANLASVLADCYRRYGAVDHLDHAIATVGRIWADSMRDAAEQAGPAANYGSMLARCPLGTGGRAMLLTNSGGSLQSCDDRTKHGEDMHAALEASGTGLAQTA